MTENLLRHETSPYLLQHADNPVHWRAWNDETLLVAKAAGRPILLSIGYAACHWCHVMAHESFEDPATAEVMNRLFTNIKVDREERPDVDAVYMASLQALGEPGGWPLTMFLTPGAEPVWGGTYFPKDPLYGRPAFIDVLQSVHRSFTATPDRIETNRAALVGFLRAPPARGTADASRETLDRGARLLADRMDKISGGLSGAPKFPQPAILEFLARSASRTGDRHYNDLVQLTLRSICQGGIYDHLGGGIARYSVDDRWLVPHFEKMLYDNALFVGGLVRCWRATGDDLFRIRIEETITWLLSDMRVGNAFAASRDADSPGGEGSFYLWRPNEVIDILGAEFGHEFCSVYDVTETGNFEGASIPNRLANPHFLNADIESRLTASRQTLLAVRSTRPAPQRDDKILADWNGLTIAALAEAAIALDRPDWLSAAIDTFRFVSESMTVAGRLRHSFKDGRLLGAGFASDYAAMLTAAIALHQATFDEAYLTAAEHFLGDLDSHYRDDTVVAYRTTAADATDLVTRPTSLVDDSVPSANALIASALQRLFSLRADTRYRDRAAAILNAHLGDPAHILGKAGLFSAADQHFEAVDVVILAPEDTGAALVHAARMNLHPAMTINVIPTGARLGASHPAHGKSALNGRPTAYVCRNQTCSLPVTEPADLDRLLKQV